MRWIWLRHAPAGLPGRFCGQSDPLLDPDMPDCGVLARSLPGNCPVYVSPLQRAGQTLEKLVACGFRPGPVIRTAAIAEQNFGELEGTPYSAALLPEGAQALAAWRPPAGESFLDVVIRVRAFVADTIDKPPGDTICIVCHAGAIRAMLAIAMDIAPEKALAVSIAHLSKTAFTSTVGGHWQVEYVNRME
jgi:alpha-ribazole phosphatase